MNTPKTYLSSMQRNMDAMAASRERLHQATQAVAGGQFEQASFDAPASASAPLDASSLRTERMANTIDATFGLMQERVLADVRNAMHRMDRLARFNTSNAQAAFAVAHDVNASTPSAPSTSQDQVIDVVVKEVATGPATPS